MYSKVRDGRIALVEESVQKHNFATDAMRKVSIDYLACSYVQFEGARKNEYGNSVPFNII